VTPAVKIPWERFFYRNELIGCDDLHEYCDTENVQTFCPVTCGNLLVNNND